MFPGWCSRPVPVPAGTRVPSSRSTKPCHPKGSRSRGSTFLIGSRVAGHRIASRYWSRASSPPPGGWRRTWPCPRRGIALGGRSMGGRMCSVAVAEGLPAAGLVLVSYPLHPPGRPDKFRVEHFGAVKVPCLFVSGTRDQFATPAELEEATGSIAGPVTLVFVDGGDHSLRRRDGAVAGIVAGWVLALRP